MSFGWKRKIGGNIQHGSSNVFADDVDDVSDKDHGAIWKKHKTSEKKLLTVTRENYLIVKQEAGGLAEREKYVEALDKFNCLLHFQPDDASIHEMISQIQQQMGEDFGAIVSAEKAICLNPVWPVAYQTLGRAFVNMGETKSALLSFSKALHLNPSSEELRREDIPWAVSLCHKADSIVKPLSAFDKPNNTVRMRDCV